MARPFSARVTGDDWRRRADSWIADRVHEQGARVTGPVEQLRVRPWATELVVPTDAGRMWFKANCAAQAFEPRLHDALARLAPGSVDAPAAVDPEQGWMLTRDRGPTLSATREPTAGDWRRVLREAAALQQATAPARDRVLATGLPDCSPGTVPDRFDRLVDLFRALPEEHPSHVDADLAARLHDVRPAVVDAAQQLAESSLPSTWQHGDLHPDNVFALDDGSLRVFDFGDAQWAHAVELLAVPFGWITELSELTWDDVVDAYGEAWDVDRPDLESQWAASARTQPVNRALTWWSCLAEATAAEWTEWGEAPLHHLRRVLDA